MFMTTDIKCLFYVFLNVYDIFNANMTLFETSWHY